MERCLQLHGRSTAVFEVFTHKDLKAAIIPADVDFQKEMLVKRQAFYDNYFRPSLPCTSKTTRNTKAPQWTPPS